MNPDNLLKIVVIIVLLIVGVLYCLQTGRVEALNIALGLFIALLGRALANYFGLGL